MKVAFITHYTTLYGANCSLLNLIDGLRKYEVDPYVISPSKGDIVDALQTRNVPVAILPIEYWVAKKPNSSHNLLKNLRSYIRSKREAIDRLHLNVRSLKPLIDKLQEWKIDIVHTNSSVIPIGILGAKWLRIPHVWHIREFGDLDYNLYPDWGSGIYKGLMALSDGLIAVSQELSNHLFSGREKEKVHVIYNGVASESEFDRLYTLNQQNSSRKNSYTFALVGLIFPSKGQEVAIKALARVVEKFPTTRLLIVGTGQKKNINHLKELAKSLSLEQNVEFWGHIKNPYIAYQQADAILMCSKNEAMGRVTVEAMSACRPVIGYDNAGTSELIDHEHTGLLYTGDHEQLAKCMLQLVKNPEEGKQMGINAWHFARERFTIEAYAQAVYQVFSSVSAKCKS